MKTESRTLVIVRQFLKIQCKSHLQHSVHLLVVVLVRLFSVCVSVHVRVQRLRRLRANVFGDFSSILRVPVIGPPYYIETSKKCGPE
jgi:hypothetical protein